MLQQQVVCSNFSNKIFFSGEAHFTLDGYVSKQNCRIWVLEDPQVIEERPFHMEKSVFGNVFGPRLWLDLPSSKTTMERLSPSIRSVMVLWKPTFLPAIEEYDLENTWFQQDCGTCHTTQGNMALLQDTFPCRVISSHGDIN